MIQFYNTASRKKEEFKPINDKKVGVYSCGPTVYWNQHIGNMYAFLNWDVLVRTLRYFGYEVNWVMNITDVGHLTSDGDTGEDKLEKGAKREGISPQEVAKKYEKQFLDSIEKLNIKVDRFCRATEHIDEQIKLAKKIDDNGYAYKTKTGLVFDTSKFADYAKFANLNLEEMDSGARVEVDKEKKKPWDFLLWITNQPNHVMKWDSPWGEGFPGWHLECTAMSTKYLGEKFDIHTGGMEHIPVHHTNEVAQCVGAYGHNSANFWLHNAWLTLKKGKMSKSNGTAYTVTDLIDKGYDPMAFRYLILQSHYRKGLVFSFESLSAAAKGLNNLRENVLLWKKEVGTGRDLSVHKEFKDKFIDKISDDLAMPEAMAVVWEMLKSDLADEVKLATILDMDKVLGLGLAKIEEKNEKVPEAVLKLVNQREKARKEKDFSESDRLRGEIMALGYKIEDSPDGCKIRKALLT